VQDSNDSVFIPIESIIKLVTANKNRRRRASFKQQQNATIEVEEKAPENLITMKTTHETLILRAQSRADLNNWVFAFQRSVALAMTKIMMAQEESKMHRQLGNWDDTSRKHDADELLYLQKAAENEDDGWEIRSQNRAHNIMQGHATALHLHSSGGRSGRSSRSMSIDHTCAPLSPLSPSDVEGKAGKSSSDALRIRTYKDRSFGDLTSIRDEAGSCATPTSPMREVCWGQKQTGAGVGMDFSAPRGADGVHLPGDHRTFTIDIFYSTCMHLTCPTHQM
jgi:hypothetical protein